MKYTKQKLRQIVTEEYSKLLKEGLVKETFSEYGKQNLVESYRMPADLYGMKITSARRSNMLPPSQSNWYAFARQMDIGVLDLDTIAFDMGFKDFNQLDAAVSPRSLNDRELKILSDIMSEMNGSHPDDVVQAAKLPYGA
tara:strand:- start:1016 stop:1435 length:420 start_codon:yes stop_codon:yes gene_type:complete